MLVGKLVSRPILLAATCLAVGTFFHLAPAHADDSQSRLYAALSASDRTPRVATNERRLTGCPLGGGTRTDAKAAGGVDIADMWQCARNLLTPSTQRPADHRVTHTRRDQHVELRWRARVSHDRVVLSIGTGW